MIDTRILLLTLVMVAGVEGLLGWIITRFDVPLFIALGLARIVEIGLLMVILAARGRGPAAVGLASMHGEPGHITTGIKKGIIWSACFGIAAGLLFAAIMALNKNPLDILGTPLPRLVSQRILFFAVGGLIAPVAEEVIFRGVVYGFLRRWGIGAALVGTTLLFSLAHMRGGVPLTQIIGGLVFAIAYEKERNLMVPIVVHVIGNMAIFSLSLVR